MSNPNESNASPEGIAKAIAYLLFHVIEQELMKQFGFGAYRFSNMAVELMFADMAPPSEGDYRDDYRVSCQVLSPGLYRGIIEADICIVSEGGVLRYSRNATAVSLKGEEGTRYKFLVPLPRERGSIKVIGRGKIEKFVGDEDVEIDGVLQPLRELTKGLPDVDGEVIG